MSSSCLCLPLACKLAAVVFRRLMPLCGPSDLIRALCLPRLKCEWFPIRVQRPCRAGYATSRALVSSLAILLLIVCNASPATAAHRQAHRRPIRNHVLQQEQLLRPGEGGTLGFAGARRGAPAQARTKRGNNRGTAAAGRETAAAEECLGRPYVNDTWLMSEESLEVGIHECRSFRDVCLDQSAYILHSQEYRPRNQSFPELPKLDISSLLVRAHRRCSTVLAPVSEPCAREHECLCEGVDFLSFSCMLSQFSLSLSIDDSPLDLWRGILTCGIDVEQIYISTGSFHNIHAVHFLRKSPSGHR